MLMAQRKNSWKRFELAVGGDSGGFQVAARGCCQWECRSARTLRASPLAVCAGTHCGHWQATAIWLAGKLSAWALAPALALSEAAGARCPGCALAGHTMAPWHGAGRRASLRLPGAVGGRPAAARVTIG